MIHGALCPEQPSILSLCETGPSCCVLLSQSWSFLFSPPSSSKNSLLKRISYSREAYQGKMNVLSSSACRAWSQPLPYQQPVVEKRNNCEMLCVCHRPYIYISTQLPGFTSLISRRKWKVTGSWFIIGIRPSHLLSQMGVMLRWWPALPFCDLGS